MSVSLRIQSAEAAFAAVKHFYFDSRYGERRLDDGISDFTFGNPHELPLLGVVSAIRQRAIPHDKNWYAYKTSEADPQAFLADLAVLAIVYVVLGWAAERLAERIPPAWEARLAWAPHFDTTVEGQTRAESVLERLLAAGAVRPLPYHVVILEHDVPNALAFPGGTIAV